jgi:hypothetical protein
MEQKVKIIIDGKTYEYPLSSDEGERAIDISRLRRRQAL